MLRTCISTACVPNILYAPGDLLPSSFAKAMYSSTARAMPLSSDQMILPARPFERMSSQNSVTLQKKILKKREKQLQSIHNETGNRLNNRRFTAIPPTPQGSQTIKEMRDRKGAACHLIHCLFVWKAFPRSNCTCLRKWCPEVVWTRMLYSTRIHSHFRLAPEPPSASYTNHDFFQQRPVPPFSIPFIRTESWAHHLFLSFVGYISLVHVPSPNITQQKYIQRRACFSLLGHLAWIMFMS